MSTSMQTPGCQMLDLSQDMKACFGCFKYCKVVSFAVQMPFICMEKLASSVKRPMPLGILEYEGSCLQFYFSFF